jgi:hypothetical protein
VHHLRRSARADCALATEKSARFLESHAGLARAWGQWGDQQTVASNRFLVERHIVPGLGRRRLWELSVRATGDTKDEIVSAHPSASHPLHRGTH